MHTLAVTNTSLIGLNAHSTRGKPCLVLETWLILSASGVMDSEENLHLLCYSTSMIPGL